MYSFLVTRAPTKAISAYVYPENYEWFTYHGAKPVPVDMRRKCVEISAGMRFGVRVSDNGERIQLVLANEYWRHAYLDERAAKMLADGVKAGGK